jgi:hypothetical protein
MRLLLASLVAASALAGCTTTASTTIDDGPDATLLVINESDYVIEEIYLTDVGSVSWGRNLLGGDVLFPGEDFLLGVDCGTYDALLVDETGVECEISSIDLCLNDADWVIRNNTCSVFGLTDKSSDKPDREATRARE